jgi:GAF domain-containing protein
VTQDPEGGAQDDVQFAARLREALSVAASAGKIGSQISHVRLLEMIVTTAVHVLRAEAGALLLVDEETEELVFEIAVGGEAETVKTIRVPVGHGVAGLVAMTGQPMAVKDARSDPVAAQDIADQVGYSPSSILCVPLFYGDRILGVIELLDKQDGTSFSPADTEALGLFANQAAVAIEQSRLQESLVALVTDVVADAGDGSSAAQRETAALAASVEHDPASRRTIELAELVQEISRAGVEESETCRALLASFADYLRRRPQQSRTAAS